MRRLLIILLFALALAIGLVIQPTRVDSYDAFEPREPETHWEYAAEQVANKWGIGELEYFYRIIEKESGWNPTAQNPRSTAFGLAQFLDSTWSLTDYEKTDDGETQILAAIQYIEKIYGEPSSAWQHHIHKNWY